MWLYQNKKKLVQRIQTNDSPFLRRKEQKLLFGANTHAIYTQDVIQASEFGMRNECRINNKLRMDSLNNATAGLGNLNNDGDTITVFSNNI